MINLNNQAQEILNIAEKYGVEANFFFITTFKRYQVQLSILNDLEKVILQEGMTITKEYVKGRKNLCSNPAVADYNRTTDSANKTVATLIRIIMNMKNNCDDIDDDPLLRILNGN